jgi:hypothetical protein
MSVFTMAPRPRRFEPDHTLPATDSLAFPGAQGTFTLSVPKRDATIDAVPIGGHLSARGFQTSAIRTIEDHFKPVGTPTHLPRLAWFGQACPMGLDGGSFRHGPSEAAAIPAFSGDRNALRTI